MCSAVAEKLNFVAQKKSCLKSCIILGHLDVLEHITLATASLSQMNKMQLFCPQVSPGCCCQHKREQLFPMDTVIGQILGPATLELFLIKVGPVSDGTGIVCKEFRVVLGIHFGCMKKLLPFQSSMKRCHQ